MVERRRKAPVFPGKDGGRLDFLRAARASSVRERQRESASRAAVSRDGEFPRPGATGSPHGSCAAKRKTGAARNPNCETSGSVEGSATRWGSLTEGAAASTEQPSRKRRRSAWLR